MRWRAAWWHGVVVLLLLAGYLLLSESIGAFSANYSWRLWLEGVVALYLYGLTYLLLRPSPWRSVLAALPLLLLYLGGDLFFLAFGKVFRLINLHEVPELFAVLPLSYGLLLGVVMALPLALLLWQLSWRMHRTLLLTLLPLPLVIGLVYTAPAALSTVIVEVTDRPVKYSDAKSVEQNGRLTMMLYREAQRQLALNELAPHRHREVYEAAQRARLQPLQAGKARRNVHLIVLESFLDPRLFTRLNFSAPPVHPEFDALFGDKLGYSLSSVFGGATAQAEFEVLCGVPALERLSSVEFNVFSGANAACLPWQLGQLGYYSSASNIYKPNFFNAVAGYQGTGFSVSHFPREFAPASASYLSFGDPGVEEYLFDGDLLDQNLNYVKQQLNEAPERPLFNYLLTIYGHTPHLLDPELRPERIELISDYPDDHLTRAVNQFYYRSEAIAHYVKKLIEIDPQGLIILVSDHVPPLRNGPNTYEALHYMDNREGAYYYNRLAIIDRGEVKQLPTIHHYDIPSLVLNLLSEGEYCKSSDCPFDSDAQPGSAERESKLTAYLELMAHASE
ncbi:MAG: LTA synthase family protein [Chromatiales bacterium]|nr:LTA synthase family protein [Chromatiales bacterium]